MNVVHQLTLRHLKANKRRTLVTICGTIISVAMITAVLIITASFMQTFQQTVKAETGDWQVEFVDVTADQVPKVAQDENTAAYTVAHFEGWVQLKGSADPRRQSMVLTGYTPESFAQLPMTMVEGVYPRNDHELLVSQNFMDTARLDWQIGETISLPKGAYFLQADGTDSYLVRADGRVALAQWQPEETVNYTIVGIAQMSSEMESTWQDGYVGLCGLDANALPAAAPVTIQQKLVKIDSGLYARGETLGADMGAQFVHFNNQLLVYYGVTKDNSFRNTMIGVVAILALVILVGSVSLIYNAFAISLAERSRMLGMLASVGATKRQKVGSVLFEAFLIGIIAIPLGLLCGYIGIAITFKCLSPALQGILDMDSPIQAILPLWALLGAVIFSAVVLLISAFVPAWRAARISPIEAIRNTQEFKMSSRQVRTSRLTRKLFGFEAELGLKNIKRSRSRYLASLLSLIISVVLFLTAATFTDYMSHSFEMTQMDLKYDVVFYARPLDKADRGDIMAAVKEQRYADSVSFGQQMFVDAEVPDSLAVPEPEDGPGIYTDENSSRTISVLVTFLDDESLKAFGDQAGIDITPLQDDALRGIVIQPLNVKQAYSFSEVRQLSKDQGALTLHTEEGNAELELIGATAERPVFMSGYEEGANILYVVSSLQAGDAWQAAHGQEGQDGPLLRAWLESRQSTLLYNDLTNLYNQYSGRSMGVTDLKANMEMQKQLQLMMSVFIYGFIALIVLVCAANIFNTISTGVILRTREFAMLRSVGITPGKFNKMVCYESLFYGIKALAYGLPISLLLAVLLHSTLGGTFGFAFYVPGWAYITAVLGVLLLVGATMAYAVRQVKRANLIDGLKNENL